MRDRTLNHILSLIRNNLKEDMGVAPSPPTTNLGTGQIAGTPESGQLPPVDLRKKKYKNLPPLYKDLHRRTSNARKTNQS